jgi:hypothetical protein
MPPDSSREVDKILLPFPRRTRIILGCLLYASKPFIVFWLIRRARIEGNFKHVHCIGPSMMMVDRCSYPGRGVGPLIKSCHCTVMRGDFPRGFRRVRETGKRLATLPYYVQRTARPFESGEGQKALHVILQHTETPSIESFGGSRYIFETHP